MRFVDAWRANGCQEVLEGGQPLLGFGKKVAVDDDQSRVTSRDSHSLGHLDFYSEVPRVRKKKWSVEIRQHIGNIGLHGRMHQRNPIQWSARLFEPLDM